MSKISMDNGLSEKSVADLSASQLERAAGIIAETGDDECREVAHKAAIESGPEEDETLAFVAAFCAEHQRRFGQVYTIG